MKIWRFVAVLKLSSQTGWPQTWNTGGFSLNMENSWNSVQPQEKLT